ncbi:hypothetical protein D3C77_451030 [compost metagenome]
MPALVGTQVAHHSLAVDLKLLQPGHRVRRNESPFNGATEYTADAAHLAVHCGRFIASLQPGCSDLLQVTGGDGINALRHDRVEVVVQGVRGLLVSFVVGFEPRQVRIVDEVA